MGNFSRDTFDKLKHYVGVRLQQGVPIVDADWNELEDIRRYELEAFLKWFVGNGVPKGNDGFRILPIDGGGINTIILTSNKTDIGFSSVVVNRSLSTAADALGFGPANYSASRVGSSPARLTGDKAEPFKLADSMTLAVSTDELAAKTVTFHASDFSDISQAKAAEVILAINKMLSDLTTSLGTGNDFIINGGRCLVEGWDVINESNLNYTAQALFNNDNLAGKWQVAKLPPLTTPTADRKDMVYLDVWEREVNAQEDTKLVNEAIGIETCVRRKRDWVVRVAEGVPMPAPPPSGHVFYPLATLTRTAGKEAIKDGDITDQRRTGLAVLSAEITIENGNVGIGTTSPSEKLNVDPQGAGGIVIGNPNTGSGGFTSLLLLISAASGGYADLQSIKSSGTAWGDITLNPRGGNVGIGTAAALTEKLDVAGNVRLTGAVPASGIGFSKTLSPKNLIAAWGLVKVTATAAEITILNGFNVSGVDRSSDGTFLKINFATALDTADYAVLVQDGRPDNGGFPPTLTYQPDFYRAQRDSRFFLLRQDSINWNSLLRDITFSFLVVGG